MLELAVLCCYSSIKAMVCVEMSVNVCLFKEMAVYSSYSHSQIFREPLSPEDIFGLGLLRCSSERAGLQVVLSGLLGTMKLGVGVGPWISGEA